MSKIIILGGMGPQASLELHRRIITTAAAKGARDNEDYPEIVHLSVPIPDFISSGDNGEGLRQLKKSLGDVRIANDDQVVLACNTAHLLLPEIEKSAGIRFISLTDTVVGTLVQSEAKTIGLLASPTTTKTQLYERPLRKIEVDVITPTDSETEQLEHAIRHVIAGGNAKDVRGEIENLIKRMADDGAEKIILGCTELSVIFSGNDNECLIDPLGEVCQRLQL